MAYGVEKIVYLGFDISEKPDCKCRIKEKEISSSYLKFFESIHVKITGCQRFIERERIAIFRKASNKKRLHNYLSKRSKLKL